MIELIDVSLHRGSFKLPNVSLEIPQGKCGLLTGAAGAGKTSIVEAICGLQTIDAGQVKLRGQVADEVPIGERGVGYLPQDVALFPDMGIGKNIGFGPRMKKWSQKAIADRIDQLATELGLQDLLKRKPHQLSGGQQKRAAMARAISLKPDIVCLDEPFASLDEASRELISDVLRRLLKDGSTTVLVVTHQRQWMEGISDFEFKI